MSDIRRYDQDVRTFLAEKIQYHKEKIKEHKRLLEEAKQQLELLGGVDKADESTERATIQLNPDKDLFKLTNWKPKVLNVLVGSEAPLTNEEILQRINPNLSENKTLRRKAITVISNSLQGFIKDEKVEIHPNEGRGNKYAIKNPHSMANGG